MRWLVRFGYDGSAFSGWARQPGRRTVEGEIRRGLAKLGKGFEGASGYLAVASRTDRGVSARANALALESDLAGPDLLRALNGIAPEIVCTAAAPVEAGFRVRSAVRRTYRYYEPSAGHDPDRWRAASRAFRGTVDARSLGRALPLDRPVWRTVESVTVTDEGPILRVEVRAPSFVWGMVRKIVAAMREVDAGRLTLTRLRRALAGDERITVPIAEPERLVLWEVEYGRPWPFVLPGRSRHQERWWRTEQIASELRQRLLRTLWDDWTEGGGSR